MDKIRYGISTTIGFRERMEDAHTISEMPDEGQTGFFSAEVYDGHGGRLAALAASEILTPFFRSTRSFTAENLRDAYLAADKYIVDRGTGSGTAAAGFYLQGDKFLAANAGDVRIVVGEGPKSIQLTVDHKPNLPEERARIEALGGKVVYYDVPRVQGSLAMSRALGDFPLKPFVTAEPRIAEGFLGRADDLAVVACDGIWDVLTSEEAVATARAANDPQEAADLLQARATELGSTDNITVIVVDLKAYAAGLERECLIITKVLDRAGEADVD